MAGPCTLLVSKKEEHDELDYIIKSFCLQHIHSCSSSAPVVTRGEGPTTSKPRVLVDKETAEMVLFVNPIYLNLN